MHFKHCYSATGCLRDCKIQTFLRRSDSTLFTPVVSRFRFFSSAFRSMTRSSDSLRTSAPSGTSTSADGSAIARHGKISLQFAIVIIIFLQRAVFTGAAQRMEAAGLLNYCKMADAASRGGDDTAQAQCSDSAATGTNQRQGSDGRESAEYSKVSSCCYSCKR